MKKILSAAIGAVLASACFAGDAACFFDGGFSADGKAYVFGQYGKTDGDYVPWAEIYAVDVERNTYIKDGVFRSKPAKGTQAASSKKAFDSLLKDADPLLKKYKCAPCAPKEVLYIMEDEEKPCVDEIVFTDFENSSQEEPHTYTVRLVPTYKGSGATCKSSFYISVTKTDSAGKVLFSKKVGTPSVWRAGITGYQITRIFADKENRGLIFVVSKKLEDGNGVSFRYMVEATRL